MSKRPKIHRVDPRLLAFAREMRHEPAPSEQKLWQCLRNRQLNGFKFRRQAPIGSYIADFSSAECRLIVELDGDSHSERRDYDAARTQARTADGYTVLRFLNADVQENLDVVLLAILQQCEQRVQPHCDPSPPPSPLSTGARE